MAKDDKLMDFIEENINKCLESKLWYKDGECNFIFRPDCKYAVPYRDGKEKDNRVKYYCKYWKS